jgi:hypothetical protein
MLRQTRSTCCESNSPTAVALDPTVTGSVGCDAHFPGFLQREWKNSRAVAFILRCLFKRRHDITLLCSGNAISGFQWNPLKRDGPHVDRHICSQCRHILAWQETSVYTVSSTASVVWRCIVIPVRYELNLYMLCSVYGARGSLVVKSLCYKLEGRGFDSRWGEFLNLPNASGRTRPWGLLSL